MHAIEILDYVSNTYIHYTNLYSLIYMYQISRNFFYEYTIIMYPVKIYDIFICLLDTVILAKWYFQ